MRHAEWSSPLTFQVYLSPWTSVSFRDRVAFDERMVERAGTSAIHGSNISVGVSVQARTCFRNTRAKAGFGSQTEI